MLSQRMTLTHSHTRTNWSQKNKKKIFPRSFDHSSTHHILSRILVYSNLLLLTCLSLFLRHNFWLHEQRKAGSGGGNTTITKQKPKFHFLSWSLVIRVSLALAPHTMHTYASTHSLTLTHPFRPTRSVAQLLLLYTTLGTLHMHINAAAYIFYRIDAATQLTL